MPSPERKNGKEMILPIETLLSEIENMKNVGE